MGPRPGAVLVVPGGRDQPGLPRHRSDHPHLHGVRHLVEHVLGLLGLRRPGLGGLLRHRGLHDGPRGGAPAHDWWRRHVLARALGWSRGHAHLDSSGCDCPASASPHLRGDHHRNLLRVPTHRNQPQLHRRHRRPFLTVRAMAGQLLRRAVLLRRPGHPHLRGDPVGAGAPLALRTAAARDP